MRKPPTTSQDAALAIVRRLREHGHEALWAGGCVRDQLLGIPPDDIDVATDAPPDRVVELFSKTRKVGMQFGVVLVRQGRHWIEVATFRTDLSYKDGRRPEGVVFTDAREDAKRRDFTINGLFYDPIEGRVIDYVGGQADLDARIIRAIGDPAARFAEDHLRMLRAVRFATRFGFTLDPATADAIRTQAERIRRISAERIRAELEKMFARPSRAEALTMMADLALLPHLWTLPEPPADTTGATVAESDPACPAQVRAATARWRALPPDADFITAMAAWLLELTPQRVEQIGRALRMSNVQIADLAWLVRNQPRIEHVETLSLAEFKRLLAHTRWPDLLAVHRARCVAESRSAHAADAAETRAAAIPPSEIAPAPLITGQDLIARGLRPGPPFKVILDTLYDAQLNGQLTERDEALRELERLLPT